MLRACIVAFALAGCSTSFQVRRDELRTKALQHGGGEFLVIAYQKKVTLDGGLVFVRGDRRSPEVYVRSLVVGKEGLCLPAKLEQRAPWQLRVAGVDPRIAARVMRPHDGVRISGLGDGAYQLDGTAGALRAWFADHRRANEDAKRNFVDLIEPRYEVPMFGGWRGIEAETLADGAPTSIGWRWTDFDHVEYLELLPPGFEPADPIIERHTDEVILPAMRQGDGLPPRACPILGDAAPLLAR